MKKIQILVIGLLCFCVTGVKAQQDPQYTQYMYNMNVVNPAYAGSKDALSIGLLGRRQWVGGKGSPRTFTASIHSPVGKNVGLGLSLISDVIGPVEETNVFSDFSYTIQTSEESNLAFGLKAGFTFQKIGLLSLTQVNPNDPLFTENVNDLYPNIGLGMYFYTDDYYLGLSIPNMLQSRHFERSNGVITDASENMHTFFTGGYVFDVSESVKLKPSFMTKFAPNAPLSIDTSLNVLLYDKFEIGASYRWDDSVSGMINFLVNNNLRLGYAYDHTTSNLSQFNSGTHEIILLFDFNFEGDIVKSPRFF